MKSLKNRSRSIRGKTDYYHRRKMIQDPLILRVRFGKKNNYYYSGIYQTPNPAKPDRGLTYVQTRWLRHPEGVKFNTQLSYVLGYLMAKKLQTLVIPGRLILDLGRQKKINYSLFMGGLLKHLPEEIKSKFCHGFTQEQINNYNIDCNTYYYHRHEPPTR